MISVKNISKNFGPVQAVRNVNFEIQPGEIVGFLGPNGAGKSTTMRMITGFITPSSGTVVVDGVDVVEDPVAVQRKIGYLPETAALYTNMATIDFLRFMGEYRGLSADRLKKSLSLVSRQCQLAEVLDRKIGDLSKGYRQRVGLAQALLHDPEVLILDEPTIGLDPNQISEIRTLIREIGKTKTILLSTHILPEVVATCTRVVIIHKGQIVAQGTPQTLTANQANTAVYSIGVRAEAAQVEKTLKALPCVTDLKVTVTPETNLLDVRLTCGGAEDLSEKIFDLAVQNGWRLSRLTREAQTLEDVFKELTQ